ncbi:hypothetical protein [Maribellus sp. YY47]|uniref:hypothetical protein n=1 Tax=Maribellus sp. YY47 TaxID=2929486 RepID=UPI0020017609|nr:hypothetical protein [Maribellus sp. YY47]MCK3684305.1 hypothetical protein [Maribellus sp. YY47]
MIRLLIIISLIGAFLSCRFEKSDKGQFEIDQTLQSGKRFFVQDSSVYAPEFISGLRKLDSEYDSVRLIGNYLIINTADTSWIPTALPLDELVNYRATRGDTVYSLGVKRISYTTIDYEFKVNDIRIKTGQVTLPAQFIFGLEFTEIGANEAIPMVQYFDQNGIWTCIKIESGTARRIDFQMQSENDSTKNYMQVPVLTRI